MNKIALDRINWTGFTQVRAYEILANECEAVCSFDNCDSESTFFEAFESGVSLAQRTSLPIFYINFHGTAFFFAALSESHVIARIQGALTKGGHS